MDVRDQNKMLRRNHKELPSEGPWQTVNEFSFPGIPGCAPTAAHKVGEILAETQIPTQVLIEAADAVTRTIEKELSRLPADQARPIFSILIRAQGARLLASPADRPRGSETLWRQKGWAFFLTGQTTKAGSGHDAHHVAISLYLYHEGSPA